MPRREEEMRRAVSEMRRAVSEMRRAVFLTFLMFLDLFPLARLSLRGFTRVLSDHAPVHAASVDAPARRRPSSRTRKERTDGERAPAQAP